MIRLIKRLLRVTYRLTATDLMHASSQNIYGSKRRLMQGYAKRLEGYDYWTLYKRGPFGLPEREIDCSLWHENN